MSEFDMKITGCTFNQRSNDYYSGYEDGAESQQAKIDELKKKYDAMYNAFIVADDFRKEWYESYMIARKERDDLQAKYDELNNRATGIALDQMTTAKLNYELQGRIDDAMDYIAESGGVNLTSEIALNDILKGNKDEN